MTKIAFIVFVIFSMIYNIAHSSPIKPADGPKNIADLMINQEHTVPMVSELNGKVNLVYFGFAGCGKTCPLALSELNNLYHQIDSNQLVVMFVNIDPLSDHKDLQQYVAQFNSKFKVAYGTKQQIDKIGDRFYALFWPDSATTYQHTDYIALVNEKGQLESLYHLSQISELAVEVKKRLLKTE